MEHNSNDISWSSGDSVLSTTMEKLELIFSVFRRRGKVISFFRVFFVSRPSRRELKKRGILKERVFGCDLAEHLQNVGEDVPVVVKTCCAVIEKHGIVDGIYRLSGIVSNIQKLRNAFDENRIPEMTEDRYLQDVHCITSLLKMYLRELPNPLLTYQLYEDFVDAVDSGESNLKILKLHDIVQRLPPPHYRTAEYLVRHLALIADHGKRTGMHVQNLAIVWAPNLLRCKEHEGLNCLDTSGSVLHSVGIQAMVVEYLIRYADIIFNQKMPPLLRKKRPGHGSPRKSSRPQSMAVSTPAARMASRLQDLGLAQQAAVDMAGKGGTERKLPDVTRLKVIDLNTNPGPIPKYHTVIDHHPAVQKTGRKTKFALFGSTSSNPPQSPPDASSKRRKGSADEASPAGSRKGSSPGGARKRSSPTVSASGSGAGSSSWVSNFRRGKRDPDEPHHGSIWDRDSKRSTASTSTVARVPVPPSVPPVTRRSKLRSVRSAESLLAGDLKPNVVEQPRNSGSDSRRTPKHGEAKPAFVTPPPPCVMAAKHLKRHLPGAKNEETDDTLGQRSPQSSARHPVPPAPYIPSVTSHVYPLDARQKPLAFVNPCSNLATVDAAVKNAEIKPKSCSLPPKRAPVLATAEDDLDLFDQNYVQKREGIYEPERVTPRSSRRGNPPPTPPARSDQSNLSSIRPDSDPENSVRVRPRRPEPIVLDSELHRTSDRREKGLSRSLDEYYLAQAQARSSSFLHAQPGSTVGRSLRPDDDPWVKATAVPLSRTFPSNMYRESSAPPMAICYETSLVSARAPPVMDPVPGNPDHLEISEYHKGYHRSASDVHSLPPPELHPAAGLPNSDCVPAHHASSVSFSAVNTAYNLADDSTMADFTHAIGLDSLPLDRNADETGSIASDLSSLSSFPMPLKRNAFSVPALPVVNSPERWAFGNRTSYVHVESDSDHGDDHVMQILKHHLSITPESTRKADLQSKSSERQLDKISEASGNSLSALEATQLPESLIVTSNNADDDSERAVDGFEDEVREFGRELQKSSSNHSNNSNVLSIAIDDSEHEMDHRSPGVKLGSPSTGRTRSPLDMGDPGLPEVMRIDNPENILRIGIDAEREGSPNQFSPLSLDSGSQTSPRSGNYETQPSNVRSRELTPDFPETCIPPPLTSPTSPNRYSFTDATVLLESLEADKNTNASRHQSQNRRAAYAKGQNELRNSVYDNLGDSGGCTKQETSAAAGKSPDRGISPIAESDVLDLEKPVKTPSDEGVLGVLSPRVLLPAPADTKIAKVEPVVSVSSGEPVSARRAVRGVARDVRASLPWYESPRQPVPRPTAYRNSEPQVPSGDSSSTNRRSKPSGVLLPHVSPKYISEEKHLAQEMNVESVMGHWAQEPQSKPTVAGPLPFPDEHGFNSDYEMKVNNRIYSSSHPEGAQPPTFVAQSTKRAANKIADKLAAFEHGRSRPIDVSSMKNQQVTEVSPSIRNPQLLTQSQIVPSRTAPNPAMTMEQGLPYRPPPLKSKPAKFGVAATYPGSVEKQHRSSENSSDENELVNSPLFRKQLTKIEDNSRGVTNVQLYEV